MTKARTLALQWVWRIQFNLNFEELWMLTPATVRTLIDLLREENKDPMQWSEEECEEFVLALSQEAPALPPVTVYYMDEKTAAV